MENDGAGYGGGDDVSPIWKVTEVLLRPVTVPTDLRTGGPVMEAITIIKTFSSVNPFFNHSFPSRFNNVISNTPKQKVIVLMRSDVVCCLQFRGSTSDRSMRAL